MLNSVNVDESAILSASTKSMRVDCEIKLFIVFA